MGRIKTPCFQFISTRGIKKYKIIDQPCCQLMSRIQTSCFLFMRRIKTPCFLFIRRLKTPCFLFMRRIKTPCFLLMIGIKTPCFLFMRRIKPRCFQFMRRIKPPCFLLTIRIKKTHVFSPTERDSSGDEGWSVRQVDHILEQSLKYTSFIKRLYTMQQFALSFVKAHRIYLIIIVKNCYCRLVFKYIIYIFCILTLQSQQEARVLRYRGYQRCERLRSQGKTRFLFLNTCIRR